MPAREVTPKAFEMVAGRHPKIGVTTSIVKHLQAAKKPVADICRNFLRHDILDKEIAELLIPPAFNHAA